MRYLLKNLQLLLILSLISSCANNDFNNGIRDFHQQNYRNAFIHLKVVAERGQPDAQYAIGYMYYYGDGVVENKEKALYWIEKAASAGQPNARKALKILHMENKNQ